MKTIKNFPRATSNASPFNLFTLALFFAYFLCFSVAADIQSAHADVSSCDGLPTDDKPFCLALKTVQSKSSCEDIQSNPYGLLLCRSLDQLFTYGTCGDEVDTTQTICKTIQIGLLRGVCGPIPSQGENKNWCEFGTYIRTEHPDMLSQLAQISFERRLEPLLQEYFIANGTPQEFESKIKSFVNTVGLKFYSQLSNREHVSNSDFVSYAGQLVTLLEENKYALINQVTGENLYFPIKTPINHSHLPSSIHITRKGQIIVLLDSLYIHSNLVMTTPLGNGSHKIVSLAVDYKAATSGSKNPFLAAGTLLPQEDSDATEFRKMIDYAQREFTFHSLVNGKPGISRMDLILKQREPSPKENETVTVIQKYYPEDLFSTREHFCDLHRGSKIAHFRGKSFERVRAQIAVRLLEGLTEAHKAKLHHMDIKLENILVEYDASGLPLPALADFGDAAQLDWLEAGRQKPRIAGTTLYMAPEYIRSCMDKKICKANMDIRGDVWSLGLVLYLLDHYNDPFELCHRTDEQIAKLISKVEDYEDFTLIGMTDFKTKPPAETFERVVYKMLNPNPKKRLTAQEALERMKEVQAAVEAKYDPEFYFKPPTPLINKESKADR